MQFLTGAAAAVFLYHGKSLWRLASPSAKTSVTSSGIFLAYQIWRRYFKDEPDPYRPLSPLKTTALCVALLLGRRVRRFKATAAVCSRYLVCYSLPSMVLDAIESFKEADTCALFAMAVASLYPGRKSSLTAILILLMLTGGEALEEYALRRAGQDLETLLNKLQLGKTAHRISNTAGLRGLGGTSTQTETIPIEDIKPGDRLLVKESEIVPVDGIALDRKRMALIDASPITGETCESIRRCKSGQMVYSGSLVHSGPMLFLEATKPAAASAMMLLKNELGQALGEERTSKMEDACSDIAMYFSPFALTLATLTFLYRLNKQTHARAAWEAALGVLVGATPCPLSIGVPVAFLSGTSVAAKHGVTLKSGVALEQLAKATLVVMDKTGTLTEGRLSMTKLTVRNKDALGDMSPDELVSLLSAAEEASGSVHAISRALCDEARRRSGQGVAGQGCSVSDWVCEDGKIFPGEGIESEILQPSMVGSSRHFTVFVGNAAFLQRKAPACWSAKHNDEDSVLFENTSAHGMDDKRCTSQSVHFAVVHHQNEANGETVLYGNIMFMDLIRPDAKDVIKEIQTVLGLKTVVLSGDRGEGLHQVSRELGITSFRTCLPHEKASIVREFIQRGETVVMVGDGVNDSAALAVANVGICIGLNDLSSNSADVVISGNGGQELSKVTRLLHLANRTVSIARTGVGVGMSISVCQMCLASAGVIPPFVNAILQEVVDLGAILNALRALF